MRLHPSLTKPRKLLGWFMIPTRGTGYYPNGFGIATDRRVPDCPPWSTWSKYWKVHFRKKGICIRFLFEVIKPCDSGTH